MEMEIRAYRYEDEAAVDFIRVYANARCHRADAPALPEVTAQLRTPAGFYPKHVKREDVVYLPAALAYFTENEDQAMLAEFWEFDRKMIHEKYRAVAKGFNTG
jgi:hypothetical protein